jgi:mono/diheme cytochrome c family protein
MKRILLVLLVAIGVITSTPSLFAACHVVRVRNVQHHHAAAAKVAVPFAVPVAVPVAIASPYAYSYSQFAGDARQPTAVLTSSHAPRSSSLVSTHCATCHGGASPASQLSLERVDRLSLADRLAAIRAVLTRRMPKGAKLDDDQLRGVVEELSNYE